MNSVDAARVALRKEARDLADTYIAMMVADLENKSPSQKEAFWDQLRQKVDAELPRPEPQVPEGCIRVSAMNDAEMRAFCEVKWPFHTHQGSSMRYMVENFAGLVRWVLRQNFNEELRRFAKHPQIARLLEKGASDRDDDEEDDRRARYTR